MKSNTLIKHVCLFLFLLATPAVNAQWEPTLNEEQKKLLSLAYDIGSRVGYPETMQFILMQETIAGKLGRVGDEGRSLGVMQVQVDTARFISERVDSLPILSDKEYAYHLKHTDSYAILVAAHYFKYCMESFGDWRRALLAYNRGVTGAKYMTDAEIESDRYMLGVQMHAPLVRKFNSERKNLKLAYNPKHYQ